MSLFICQSLHSQDSILSSPSPNPAEDKVSDCFLSASPACRPSAAGATCETSHFTFSCTSCSRRRADTGTPSLPLHITLPSLSVAISESGISVWVGTNHHTSSPGLGLSTTAVSLPILVLPCLAQGHWWSLPLPVPGSF